MATPSNSVFRGVYKLCQEVHPNTTDYIDWKDGIGDLPLVYVGESIGTDEERNLDLIGRTNRTIHVYSTRRQRSEAVNIVAKIRNGLMLGIEEYSYNLVDPRIEGIREQDDNSMGQPLLHFIIDYSVMFTKKPSQVEPEPEPEDAVATLDELWEYDTVIKGTATEGERILIFVNGRSNTYQKVITVKEGGNFEYRLDDYTLREGDMVTVLWLSGDARVLVERLVLKEDDGDVSDYTPEELFDVDIRGLERELIIKEYLGNDKKVNIAEKMYNATVVEIGGESFRRKGLESVIIPNSVTSIGNYAFSDNQLTSVVIPDSVTTIGSGAFYYNELTSVKIPDSVTSISEGAFRSNQLTSVKIPDSVMSIGTNAFSDNQLTSVVIPDSVTTIGNYAFSNNQLTSVEIPDNVTSIGERVFQSNQLTSVVIPDSVTSIDNGTFLNNQLTSVEIPDSVTSIDSWVFFGNNLTSVVIPDSVTSIGDYAFDNNAKEGKDFIIYGYRDTEAERYADSAGHTFIALDEEEGE